MPNKKLFRIVIAGSKRAIEVNEKELRELRRLYRLAWKDVKDRLDYLRDLEARLGDLAGHGPFIRATREQLATLEATWRALEQGSGEIYIRVVNNAWQIGLATSDKFAAALGISLGMVPQDALFAMHEHVLTLAGDVTAELANRIKGEVMRGILSGGSVQKVAKRVVGTGITTKGTPFRKAINRAEVIVRTETTRVFNLSTIERWKPHTEIVGFQWSAYMDKRTCPECAALDGQYWPKGQEQVPPLHPSCRCCLVPVTRTYGKYEI